MGKNVVLGITGGIAAYKMASVASSLTQQGYNVRVVMTASATEFIAPLTFESITGNPVENDLFSPPEHYDVKHISLADWADLLLVAPATANIIGKMASGIADDLLSTLVLSVKIPILVAPAMNTNMYNNYAVRDNIECLKQRGVHIIEPDSGYLACGETGKGRLPAPQDLTAHVEKILTVNDFQDKKVLISAGPTREELDPVRFLSNYSSGKMGYALARQAAFRGAEVTLVSGPVSLEAPLGVNPVTIKSAREMHQKIMEIYQQQDVIIMAAAVADFRPSGKYNEKIKKAAFTDKIELDSNPDILAELGKKVSQQQVLVGFAAESSRVKERAQKKLEEKKLDLIIANDITGEDTGFGSDYNQAYLISRQQKELVSRTTKNKLAAIILDKIKKMPEDEENG